MDEVVKTREQSVRDAEEYLNTQRVALRGAIKVRESFPDAVFHPTHSREGGYYRSNSVMPDSVDPNGIAASCGSRGIAENVLYKNVAVHGGFVRIYSAVRVNIYAGFEAYNASNGSCTLFECLMATADEAQKAFLANEEGDARRAKASADTAAAQALRDAKPVRIVADDTKLTPTPAS